MFETLKFFKALDENTLGNKIKALISDNGGEYIKREFQQLCASTCIQMQHSSPYTPQQNGVAKRKNRSLKEMDTCLLEAINIPPYLWDEAVNYGSYIHNTMPDNSVIGVTPFKEFMGHNPNVSHVRVFFSKAWAEILTDKRKSFQDQSSECILLGYVEDANAYKLMENATKKCIA